MVETRRRVKKGEQHVGVRLDAVLVAKAKKKAEAEHRTVSQVVRMLIERWLGEGAA